MNRKYYIIIFIGVIITSLIIGITAINFDILYGKFDLTIALSGLAVVFVMAIIASFVAYKKKYSRKNDFSRRKGTVKWFNQTRGFGFIAQDWGEDLFVHKSQIQDNSFKILNKNDRVEFDIGKGRKGPFAKNVQSLSAYQHKMSGEDQVHNF